MAVVDGTGLLPPPPPPPLPPQPTAKAIAKPNAVVAENRMPGRADLLRKLRIAKPAAKNAKQRRGQLARMLCNLEIVEPIREIIVAAEIGDSGICVMAA